MGGVMAVARDKGEFVNIWKNHVGEIYSVSAQCAVHGNLETSKEISAAIDNLKSLIEKAGKELF